MALHSLHSRLECIDQCSVDCKPSSLTKTHAHFTHHTQEMIDEADRNGDGQIDEDEFYRIMKKTSLF